MGHFRTRTTRQAVYSVFYAEHTHPQAHAAPRGVLVVPWAYAYQTLVHCVQRTYYSFQLLVQIRVTVKPQRLALPIEQ